MPYAQVLELATIPTLKNVYQIGCYARRVTLYSQQARGINLVDAIHYVRTPLTGKTIAIVGGGAAGVTAAARAVGFGAKVTVFDKAPNLVSIQANSRHRWLHPTLYEWPFAAVDIMDEKACLPVMDWSASNANEVAARLQDQFVELRNRHPHNLEFIPSSEVTRLENEDSGRVRLHRSGDAVNPFDVAILAVGFGLEPFNWVQNSYWEGDPIDNTSRSNGGVLIVGYGDGALTDLMRACILNFDHEQVLKQLIQCVSEDDKLDVIRAIEMHPRAGQDAFLTDSYASLNLPGVQACLEKARNSTRKVVLAGPGPYLFSARASALNRMIVSQLHHLQAFHHIKFDAASKIHGSDRDDPVLKTVLTDVERALGNPPEHILLRFGPQPVIDKIGGISAGIGPLEADWKKLETSDDYTRDRIWESPFATSSTFAESCLVFGHRAPTERLELVAGSALLDTTRKTLKVSGTDADQCVKNRAALLHMVEALCHAPIALFALGEQMGSKNMAGMLLLGIRAAVRRGVTLLVHDEEIGSKEWSNLPFNLRELQVMALPLGQQSADALSEALRSADEILNSDSSGYRDLPVFEIVRRTRRRTPVLRPNDVELFTLCSFSGEHEKKLWPILTLLLRGQPSRAGGKLVLKRVTDYSSPLLVAERLYELIRFAGQCVVDWSEWRPNVFFEFGVRLAVNPVLPISIIQESDLLNIDAGRRRLVDIFRPIPYPVKCPS
jgi:hypothetical protein